MKEPKLKFKDLAHVGDTIKAFDFPHMEDRADSFVIGKVISKGEFRGYEAYTIMCSESVDHGRKDLCRVGQEVYVPFEVEPFEFDDRITKLN
jgi:hypothetical protein